MAGLKNVASISWHQRNSCSQWTMHYSILLHLSLFVAFSPQQSGRSIYSIWFYGQFVALLRSKLHTSRQLHLLQDHLEHKRTTNWLFFSWNSEVPCHKSTKEQQTDYFCKNEVRRTVSHEHKRTTNWLFLQTWTVKASSTIVDIILWWPAVESSNIHRATKS
jgi:hypothetical protein